MTRFFLGVDIGATKSQALIADESGRALGLGSGGPGNYEAVGYDGLASTLNAITSEALHRAGLSTRALSGAGFGIAGYDWPAEAPPTRQAIETLGLSAPYEFVNDATLGLIAGTSQGWGVAVVSGTSCNCRGRDSRGREGRVTGNGPWMDEYGGGGELVAKAVHAIARDWTQRGPTTRLTAAFIQATGASDASDLLQGLALGQYQLSAGSAPIVFQAAEAGDAVAQELVRWLGRELGSLTVGVIRQLSFQELDFEVVLVGSMFKGSPVIEQELAATVHAVAPRARLVRLVAPPVVGGVLLGMEQTGLDWRSNRGHLTETTNRLLRKT